MSIMLKSEESQDEEKDKIEKWVHRWGSSGSEAVFDPGFHFFYTADIEGLIGYKLELGCAVVFGDPICSFDDRPKLVQDFHRFCQEKKWDIVYLIASEQFAEWTLDQQFCHVLIEVGEELTFDPQSDPRLGPSGYKLRNKISHSQHLGLLVKEYQPFDANLENSIEEVGQSWLKSLRGPQIALGKLNFFSHLKDRRWFYAINSDKIMGVALLCRLESRQGWLLKFLTTIPEAPRGTSEFLMMSILEKLQSEGCHFLTYGIVAASSLGEIKGVNSVTAWIMKKAFIVAKWIFKLDKRKIYWKQFHPKPEKCFVLFSHPKVNIQEIRALMKALNIKFI